MAHYAEVRQYMPAREAPAGVLADSGWLCTGRDFRCIGSASGRVCDACRCDSRPSPSTHAGDAYSCIARTRVISRCHGLRQARWVTCEPAVNDCSYGSHTRVRYWQLPKHLALPEHENPARSQAPGAVPPDATPLPRPRRDAANLRRASSTGTPPGASRIISKLQFRRP